MTLETLGVALTLCNVYLLTRQNILAWPCGLLGVSIYAFIFFQTKLYSDFILHLVYVILNIYGWWVWSRKNQQVTLPVTQLSRSSRIFFIALIIFSFLLWGTTMSHFTDASYPYLDAFTTVVSLVAQYLLAKKKIENWILWIIVDIFAIVLYLLKALNLTAGLYLLLLVLSIIGFLNWKASFYEEQTPTK